MTLSPEASLEFARYLDQEDDLNLFRQEFIFPLTTNGQEKFYFNGNSLGLQPKKARQFINNELDIWAEKACDGHIEGETPWVSYHETVTENLSTLTGAKVHEVVCMNSLTTNLHLLMVSFYRPQKKRYKIVIEKGAFPSDRYAVLSQLSLHGYDETGLIEVEPRPGSSTIHNEDFLKVIEEKGEEIALILLGSVQYYTGQVFDIPNIIKKGHEQGCIVGLDLAHAIGNVCLNLHDWNADFAVWCSYKYLNGGPGSIGGAFVHEKHIGSRLPKLHGWWGSDKVSRFKMLPGFVPIPSVESWQLSNPPIFQLATLRASLDIFKRAGMENLRKKSLKLISYMDFLLSQCPKDFFEVITPQEQEQRGSQMSLKFKNNAEDFFNYLQGKNVLCDYRYPNVIRIALVPLYNRFVDAFELYQIINEGIPQWRK